MIEVFKMKKKALVCLQNATDVTTIVYDVLTDIIVKNPDLSMSEKKSINNNNEYLAATFVRLVNWMRLLPGIDISPNKSEEHWIEYGSTYIFLITELGDDKPLPEDSYLEISGDVPMGVYVRFMPDIEKVDPDLIQDLTHKIPDAVEIFFGYLENEYAIPDVHSSRIEVSVGDHVPIAKIHHRQTNLDLIKTEGFSDIEKSFYKRIRSMLREVKKYDIKD